LAFISSDCITYSTPYRSKFVLERLEFIAFCCSAVRFLTVRFVFSLIKSDFAGLSTPYRSIDVNFDASIID
jgi:hypothetical protein